MSAEYMEALLEEPVPREWAFGESEYEERLARVRRAMIREGIDVLLLHGIVDMCYVTGYQTLWPDVYSCVIVPAEGEPFMQTSEIEASCAILHGPLTDFVPYQWSTAGWVAEELAKLLESRGFGKRRIGVQKGRLEIGNRGPLDAAAFQRLEAMLPNATFVDATFLMFEVRLKKSEAEVEALRKASGYTLAGMSAAIEATASGVLDNHVAAAASAGMYGAGSEFFSMDPVVSAGHRSGWFHTNFKRHQLQRGDHVLLELGGVHGRYCAPLMRTVVLGTPSDRAKRLEDALSNTLNLLYEGIKPGRTAHDVASAAARGMKPVEDMGIFRSGMLGYSVGLSFPSTWTDGPMYLMEGNDRVLEPGMVFHTPPSLRIPREMVVGFSDTFVVTDTGYELLTDGRRHTVIKDAAC